MTKDNYLGLDVTFRKFHRCAYVGRVPGCQMFFYLSNDDTICENLKYFWYFMPGNNWFDLLMIAVAVIPTWLEYIGVNRKLISYYIALPPYCYIILSDQLLFLPKAHLLWYHRFSKIVWLVLRTCWTTLQVKYDLFGHICALSQDLAFDYFIPKCPE